MDIFILELVVAFGAAVQSTIGFGVLLVAAPVMAVLMPGSVPAASLMVALPITASMAAREHRHIDAVTSVRVLVGLLPGTVVGALVVHNVDARVLTVWIGAAIVAASLIAARRRAPSIGPAVSIGAGLASGFINTIAGTGGPPIALLYRDRPGPEVRSTLAVIFFVSGLLSLVAVAFGGALGVEHLWLAVRLMPGVAVGIVAGRLLHGRVSDRALRGAVVLLSVAAGIGAIVRGMLA